MWKFVFRQKLLKTPIFLPNVWQNINFDLARVIPLGVPGPPDLVPDVLFLLLLLLLDHSAISRLPESCQELLRLSLAVTHHSLLVLVMTVNGNQ